MDGALFLFPTPRHDRLVAQVGAAVVAAAQMMTNDPHPEAEYAELLQLCWLVVNDSVWIEKRNKRREAAALGRTKKGLAISAGYADFDADDPREIARAVKNELREERRKKAGGKKAATFVQFDDAYSSGDAGEAEADADAGTLAEERRTAQGDIAEAFGEVPHGR